MTTVQSKILATTGDPIAKGETAWRPIGNQSYRSQRLSGAVMARVYESVKGEEVTPMT